MSVPAPNARPPAPVMMMAAHRAVLRHRGADLAQPVVHGEGQRVVRLRPVEGDDAGGALHLVQDFRVGGVFHCCCALLTAHVHCLGFEFYRQ
jgi:hypothetical protein